MRVLVFIKELTVIRKIIKYFTLADALIWCSSVVLILLWSLASIKNTEYLTVVFCFVAFLINDLYGFISWSKMEKRQLGGGH